MGYKIVSKLSFFVLIFCCLILLSCDKRNKKSDIDTIHIASSDQPNNKPNILWIVAEDLSPYIPTFGDSTVVTPHISRLAAEGISYDNFYAPHPVCAPARAATITGMYANSIGASHMRTGPWFMSQPSQKMIENYQKNAMPDHIEIYEAVPAAEVRMFTEYLRKEGYYCSNNSKEDYQFVKTPMAWDDSSNQAHWRNRGSNQPFFSVFNIEVTHESQIWQKQKDSLWVDKDLPVPVPPYLPDTDIAKNDIRRMYSNIVEMDTKVGQIINDLEADGLLENTIVFWFTDHGGPLPRQKRLLYDSGLKVPMVIRFPNAAKQNTRNTDMISFIDLAPSLLSLAGIKAPDHMQGSAFLGDYQPQQKPIYVFGAADRFDESTDKIRSVRDKRFKYIKYYETEKPLYLDIAYRNQMPIMQELHRLRSEGNLDKNQALWFRDIKPKEELFDTQNDPFEIHDLANDPAYQTQLENLRQICQNWVEDINDTGLIAEEQLISIMIPNGKQPKTQEVKVTDLNGSLQLLSNTQGASIGYKVVKDSVGHKNIPWMIYDQPFRLKSDQKLLTIAHRIGYKPSKITQYN